MPARKKKALAHGSAKGFTGYENPIIYHREHRSKRGRNKGSKSDIWHAKGLYDEKVDKLDKFEKRWGYKE